MPRVSVAMVVIVFAPVTNVMEWLKLAPPVTVTSTPFILKTRNSATIRNRAEDVECGGFCYGTNGKG